MIKRVVKKISHSYISRWTVLFIDLFLVMQSFLLAYLIRFNFRFSFDLEQYIYQQPIIVVVALSSFLIVGSYKSVVRHTGLKDAYNIFLGVSLIAVLSILLVLINRQFNLFEGFTIPISIIVIHFLLNASILIVSRLVFKILYRKILSDLKLPRNTLIYGAGDSGIATYAAINRYQKKESDIYGFIDDNHSKIGKTIDMVPIFSLKEIHENFIKKHKIKEVIVSIQNIEQSRLLEIVDYFIALSIKVKIVPPVQEWINGKLHSKQIQQVKIEDLLGREPINLKNPTLMNELRGKKILVTGAAGSIGSEIARNISRYEYAHLVLLDQAESSLYDIQQEFKLKGHTKCSYILSDIKDKERVEKVFEFYKPDLVFHAAAYKHVPLMENNPYEAIKVNVLGTKILANLSIKYNVSKFVMISTDKAVNPTNVMGATKRVAEMYIRCLLGKGKTKFITTRFGNVLGSNGSVIPLFKKQIEAGGPLTVTHKEIKRFFMTIPEACQLVLEACAMGEGGQVLVFDMGKSIKIYDLAVKMILLSGLRHPEDIDIKITGLRPGEKINEELLADGETTLPTHHDKIMIAKIKENNNEEVIHKILELCNMTINCQNSEIVSKIKEIVPEYISNNSLYEILDITRHKKGGANKFHKDKGGDENININYG